MIDMVKLHNNKRYRELDLGNYYFVMSGSEVQVLSVALFYFQ